MTETLWDKVMQKSDILHEHLTSSELAEELEEVTGDPSIYLLDENSRDNLGFITIWMSMATLRKRLTRVEKHVEKVDKDSELLFERTNEQREQIKRISNSFNSRKAETAEYIRNLSERKYNAYQRLLEAQTSDLTQKEIAHELEMDEAVLSRFKNEFKENNIL
jgi:hypothetical protein